MTPDSARTLLATHPGYQQIERSGTRLRVMQFCFRSMVPGANRDTIPVPPSSRAWLYPRVCDHLERVRERRGTLESFAAALIGGDAERSRIVSALDSARAYLPAAASAMTQPTIYGLLFEPNGFGGETIAVDLLSYFERRATERVNFLAHELFHALRSRLPTDVLPAETGEQRPGALRWLLRTQEEGIASLIDKRALVTLDVDGPRPASSTLEGFPREHAARIGAARITLGRVDVALAALALGTLSDSAAMVVLDSSIADGGHAMGQYMALAIEAREGRAGIRAVSTNRFDFVRAYQRAATASPRTFAPFGETAMAYFDRLAERFSSKR